MLYRKALTRKALTMAIDFTPAPAQLPAEALDAARERDRALGLCPAEQLPRLTDSNIPWMCSHLAGHEGLHETWVTATFNDGRPDWRYAAHAWS